MNNTHMWRGDEQLILVDDDDNIIGPERRDKCHTDVGLLHRAFSIYIFNSQGQLLLQRRSKFKQLWAGYWANSCCSHPLWGEETEVAAQRRLEDELGLVTPLSSIFKFKYSSRNENFGSETELCTVFIGKSDKVGVVDPNEVEEWKFVDSDMLDDAIVTNEGEYTPWLRIAWKTLRSQHWDDVQNILDCNSF